MTNRTLGEVGYLAYGNAANWKTFDGRPMPTWHDLGTTEIGRETQRRWESAAEAIESRVSEEMVAAVLT